jgi:hypothetical protein
MLIIDGLNENQKGKSVINVVNLKYVNDHGRNILKCMVGKNLFLLSNFYGKFEILCSLKKEQ